MSKKTFSEALVDLFKQFGLFKSKVEETEEQMISYEIVYEPDTVDAHGQFMNATEIEKACENFNANLKQGVVVPNLFHLQETNMFSIEDTWIQKEFDVNVSQTGEPIKAGSWVAKIQYNDPKLWELKKSGVIQGVSFGGKGVVNEETGEITNLIFDGETDE